MIAARRATPVPIIGIGASAGGLEALSALFHALPPDTGAAYIVVQHLDPVHESALAELLGRVTAIPVAQATNGVPVEANRAYVIPPGTSMVLDDGRLQLAARAKSPLAPRPVDVFFRSLADGRGSDAVGVVLSGNGSDGASGVEAIKSVGGITFAQDPASARFDGMPAAAMATGCVDFVLRPTDNGRRLADIGRHPLAVPADGTVPPADATLLATVFHLLRRRSGIDFAEYKPGTIRRRLLRRMVLQGIDSLPEYVARLQGDPEELNTLHADLLIGVTRFFRDASAFAALTRTALPAMMKDRPTGTPIRVWVPGCATGEEAYSVAICLLEYLDGRADAAPVQIFATDVSESAIAVARKGVYSARIVDDVSPERLARYFVHLERGYQISQIVRDRCVFARQNVTSDPPFSQLDLVSCRNVLIYLQAAVHARVFAIFQYALRPGGLLILGTSESAGAARGLFAPIDRKHQIYTRSRRLTRPLRLDFAASPTRDQGVLTRASAIPVPHGPLDVLGPADQILAAFASAAVVVDDAFRSLQFRGQIAPYLDPPSGAATLDITRMVRSALRTPLRGALRRAKTSAATVRIRGLRLGGDDDAPRQIGIRVIPFQSGPTAPQHFVVTFEEDGNRAPATPFARAAGGRRSRGAKPSMESRTVAELRIELDATRHELRAVTDELQTFMEESQAATEEAQSSNEELQSSNEELETAKEELQSGNEELMTLNDELRARIEELGRLNDDLSNVTTAIQVPLVIVGPDLLIRRFTAGAERLMRLAPTDIGRPIGDIKSYTDVPDLEDAITRVLRTLVPEVREVQDNAGRWYELTIRPYLTAARRIDGVVLVYHDVDMRLHHSRELDAARNAAELANQTKASFLTTMSHELRTPLNAIGGYAALLAEGVHGPVTTDQARDLDRIRIAGRHLLGLINDILNYAKLQAVQVRIASEDIVLEELLADAAAMTEPQARAKGIAFTYAGGDRSLVARGDREKVLQIVLNLLGNAIKFTGPSGQVALAYQAVDGEARVCVRDTGRGIRPDELGRIFEPFVQVGQRLQGGDAGVGLGLAISRELARAMRGELIAESTLGEGSAFTLTLPRGSGDAEPARDRLRDAERSSTSGTA